MASNPMQRKARNSFLLGVIVTLLIAGVIIALLFMQLKNNTKQCNSNSFCHRYMVFTNKRWKNF